MQPRQWISVTMICAALIQACLTANSLPEADKNTSLPRQPQANFQQYAGYITVDEKQQRSLFYYFVEAETDPASKPLVLWFNGAFLTANSLPEADKITSLPGQPQVSFQQYAGYVTVDEKQQRALFYYFVEAETDAASKPLVLWLNGGPGCSSVGAGAFIEHGPFKPSGDILLKNDFSWNKEANMLYLESPAGVGFSYSSNQSFYDFVNDAITANDNLMFLERWFDKFPEFKNRDFFITGESYGGHYVPELARLVVQSKLNSNLKGIAIGNPLLDFNTDFNTGAEYYWSHGLISDATFEKISNFINQYDVTLDVCLSSDAAQSRKLTQLQETEKIDVCLEDETIKYLNRQDVQEALHARLIGVSNWTICSDGDQDSVIPLTGTRTAVDGLAEVLELNTTVPYRVWFEEKQVAGWTQVYGDVLSFATIRGAGHTAPYTQPERSLLLFSSFLGGKPLPEALTH
ncbi:unnamed protein product [Prunus armeniaca]|uniref:Carboxypeptidase n=1 Tax=Prunus armeniaca TaxID=36596 RepID=A0A6J5XWS9_PRUAR|nr:unnamed protein product [Prunus armeniaca]